MTAYETAVAAAKAIDGKKGLNIQVIEIGDVSVIADYMVIATGNSSTHVKALADEVEYQIDRRGLQPYGVEGRDNNTWLLLDYSNVIVHIFSREAREFYNLDKLYAD